MCLVVIARPVINGRPVLVIAANRDEYHERPAEPLHWWSDRPDIAAGRDLRANGTWLGVRRDGRFAAVLNGAEAPPSGARSRGDLIVRWLTRSDPSAATLQSEAQEYAGFHCLAGDGADIHYLSRSRVAVQAVTTPVACGNGGIDEGGPRLERAASAVMAACMAANDPVPGLFAALADRSDPSSAVATDAGDGDARPVFITGEQFGTRCSSVVILDPGHRGAFHERRYDGQARLEGERTLAWPLRRDA